MQVERGNLSYSGEQRKVIYDSWNTRVDLVKRVVKTCSEHIYDESAKTLLSDLDELESSIDKNENPLTDPEILYRRETRSLFDGIRVKKVMVDKLRESDDTVLDFIKRLQFPDGEVDLKGDVYGVKYAPIWIRVNLSDDVFDQLTKETKLGCLGLHISDTPIVLIRNTFKDDEKILDHELTHLVLDGCSTHYSANRGGTFLQKSFEKMNKSEADYEIPERKDLLKKKLVGRLNPTLVLDSLHEEMLADNLDEIINRIASSLGFDISKMLEVNSYNQFLQSLSTAGNEIGIAKTSYERISGDESVEKSIRDLAEVSGNSFESRLKQMYLSLMNSSFLVNQFGNEASTDFGALLYILKPSQYRHIPGFLEYKYKS